MKPKEILRRLNEIRLIALHKSEFGIKDIPFIVRGTVDPPVPPIPPEPPFVPIKYGMKWPPYNKTGNLSIPPIFDTGVILDEATFDTDEYEIGGDMSFLEPPTGIDYYQRKRSMQIGLRPLSTNGFAFSYGVSTDGKIVAMLGNHDEKELNPALTNITNDGSRHEFSIGTKNGFILDGVQIAPYTTRKPITDNVNVVIGGGFSTAFGNYTSVKAQRGFEATVYRMYIRKKGVMIHDFRPVPAGDTTYSTTPAPEVCFFDLITGKYVTKIPIEASVGSLGALTIVSAN